MVRVYSSLDGFPTPAEQPAYCGHAEVILHTTAAMQTAWAMYERMSFVRAEELDFLQEGFPVYGFRLRLRSAGEPRVRSAGPARATD